MFTCSRIIVLFTIFQAHHKIGCYGKVQFAVATVYHLIRLAPVVQWVDDERVKTDIAANNSSGRRNAPSGAENKRLGPAFFRRLSTV